MRASLADFYLPDGTWYCTVDHRTEPCGRCRGCRQVAAINAACRAADRYERQAVGASRV